MQNIHEASRKFARMRGEFKLKYDNMSMARERGLGFEAHVSEFLCLRAGKGGDAGLGQQLAGDARDGRGRHQEACRQLQVAIVLHHAHEPRLHHNMHHEDNITVPHTLN